jgi:SAM-dependent methyltransferase
MLEYTWPILHQGEMSATNGSVHAALRSLRQLSLLDFGQFFLTLPNPHFPHLSSLLPRMAADDVQRAWTGADGIHLLSGTVDFVRMMKENFESICHRPLDGAHILDYGCGYGRIARLLYRFVDPENYLGVDPWNVSLDLCRQDGLLGTFAQSDYLPDTLPVGPARFDLAFAFSVFTHTSLNATLTGLRAIRRHIKPNGLLVITIRPIEFWNIAERITNEDRQALVAQHRADGFAFVSDGAIRTGDEATFGDTTIALDWFAAHVPEWRVERVDRGLDGWQIVVMLSPN